MFFEFFSSALRYFFFVPPVSGLHGFDAGLHSWQLQWFPLTTSKTWKSCLFLRCSSFASLENICLLLPLYLEVFQGWHYWCIKSILCIHTVILRPSVSLSLSVIEARKGFEKKQNDRSKGRKILPESSDFQHKFTYIYAFQVSIICSTFKITLLTSSSFQDLLSPHLRKMILC